MILFMHECCSNVIFKELIIFSLYTERDGNFQFSKLVAV